MGRGPRLNPAQAEAVEHAQGPLLVLAGAGSGKTRVITHRIARLLERGVRPEAILAVSFTNKAAAEMADRMATLVGKSTAKKLWLSTFHSFGVRFIGEESKALGHGGRFVIFDQGDCLGMVRELLRKKRGGDRKLDASAVHSRISLWKNKFLGPGDIPESEIEYDEAARDIYADYESSLRSMRAVDFDDLVLVPVRVLSEHEGIRERWRARFRHVMIDEFQDTNRSQLELVRLLTNQLGNVCVVGDDDQSIYAWRGADVGNILDFERHFPGARVVKLETNYRSYQPILEVANAAIGQSTQRRHGKFLRSARGPGEPVRVSVLDDAAEEAKFIVREIRDAEKQGRDLADFAVLYRSALQARLVEEELRGMQIPYRVYGGGQFFDRKEVKDATAYLRVLVNPLDELSLRRIVNYPARGIGATTVERVGQHAAGHRLSFHDALANIDRIEGASTNARRSAVALLATLERHRRKFADGGSLAGTALSLFEETGLKRELLDEEGGKVGAKKWENVQFLLRSLDRYESAEYEGKPKLQTFLQRLTMRQETSVEEARNRITLSTLHAAKGLEFPVVFLMGCYEGQLPHNRTTDPKVTEAAPSDVEEERRLFYVGVTRAQDVLYLTRPRQKMIRGRVLPLTPSRFLDGLPEVHLASYERDDKKPLTTEDAAKAAADILKQLGG